MAEKEKNGKVTQSNPQDPTLNVRELMNAAVTRLDDLAEAERRRVDDIASLTADFTERLSVAEAKRIDAVRAIDVNAVAVAAERATQQATVLANQVSISAETLRALVSTTATNIATQLSTLTNQLTDRISSLEKTQYTTTGKGSVIDPQMEALIKTVSHLEATLANNQGSKTGMQNLWGWIVGGLGLIIALMVAILPHLK